MKHTYARVGGLMLSACITVGFVQTPARAAESPMAQGETKQVAQVEVEIKQESGKVAKNVAQLDWNAPADVSFEGADHQHDVKLELQRPSERSRKVSITLAYDRDGEAIIAPYTIDTRVKKREVIRIEGGLAIALTVVPKRIELEKPKDDTPDFDPGEGNDPLSGL